MNRRRQSGISTTEYLVVLLWFVTALMVPIVDDKNAFELLAEALKNLIANFNYGIGLPRLR